MNNFHVPQQNQTPPLSTLANTRGQIAIVSPQPNKDWNKPWRSQTEKFSIVDFFNFIRIELENELKGEMGDHVAPQDVQNLKERVSIEFEKTKKSFEGEMDYLKELMKVSLLTVLNIFFNIYDFHFHFFYLFFFLFE